MPAKSAEPSCDFTSARPDAVFDVLMDEALDADPLATTHDRPAMRVPDGPLLDLHEAFSGRPLYDPAGLHVPTLPIRGGCDPTSTATDMVHLAARLPKARAAAIPNGPPTSPSPNAPRPLCSRRPRRSPPRSVAP